MAETFETTSWSLVQSAGCSEEAAAKTALEALCQRYWGPLFAHVRRRGYSREDAEDLTQAFFCHLLESGLVGRADRCRGHFRTYLLVSLDYFVVDTWRREHARQRGRGSGPAVLDPGDGGGQAGRGADLHYDRAWARAMVEAALARLEGEFTASGKGALFAALRPFLTGDGGRPGPCADLSPGAQRVAVHRVRRRFAQLLREEVARTVVRPDEVDEEMHYLITVLGSGEDPL